MANNRILSIDIFRGLTIFAMVFVNDLAGVTKIPGWMKHAAADADAMTFVDVVFPAFLFIVGMAIPLALRIRLAKGQSNWEIGKHILIRTTGLIVLGVFMVNSEEMNADANLIPKWIWDILFYISAILIWNRYPKAEGQKTYLYWGLRIVGIITLIVLWQLFRKGETDQFIGMTHSWWGILGLIGWAYLLSVAVYLLFKDNLPAIVGVLGLFIMIVVGLKSEGLHLPAFLGWLKSQSGHFAHAALCLAGMILSMLFMESSPVKDGYKRIRWMVVIGVLCLIAGYFLRPLYGISKIYATPTWVLYCVAICCFLYPLIYWLADLKGHSRWANFLKPAGVNPLLTYILPYIFYAVVGFSYLPSMFNEGILGIVRSVVFSLFILGIAALLTRWKVRLHL